MLIAMHGNGSANHGEPKERQRHHLIDPDDGVGKYITRNHAAQEQGKNKDQQQCCDNFQRFQPGIVHAKRVL